MGRIVLLEITLPMFTPDQLESEFGKIKFEKKEGYLIEYIQKLMIKEDKEVIIASSMLDGNRYFIYRDDGVEVQVDINGENYSHNKPITKPEYNKIKMMKKIRGKKQDKNIITNEPRYFQSKMNSEM